MILKKKDYHHAKGSIKSFLELHEGENKLVLARRLVHMTQAPLLIVYALVLDLTGHDEELYKEFLSVSKWYGDTVE